MRKIFLLLTCCAVLLIGLNACHAKNLDNDVWIHTTADGTAYYLRDYGAAARSWCFAHVVTVDTNNAATELIYRFESSMDSYSVYRGSEPVDTVKRDAKPLESGKVSDNFIASTIWNNYIRDYDAERLSKIHDRAL